MTDTHVSKYEVYNGDRNRNYHIIKKSLTNYNLLLSTKLNSQALSIFCSTVRNFCYNTDIYVDDVSLMSFHRHYVQRSRVSVNPPSFFSNDVSFLSFFRYFLKRLNFYTASIIFPSETTNS